jgi:transcriptional regulator with XRE-family HTH domain
MIKKSHFVSTLVIQKRKKLQMSQTALSARLGWSNKNAQYVSNVERGLCQFPTKSIKMLSIALQTPVEEIINAFVEDYKLGVRKEVYDDPS